MIVNDCCHRIKKNKKNHGSNRMDVMIEVTKSEKMLMDRLTKAASELGMEVAIVGGWTRDHLLSRPFGDIDVVIHHGPDDPIHWPEKLAGKLSDKYIKPYGNANTFLVRLNHHQMEIGCTRSLRPDGEIIRGVNLEEDARSRDFSINAIYYLPKERTFFDPLQGRQDLERHLIRALPGSFEIDPLRVLRGIRLVLELDQFELCKETKSSIKKSKHLLTIDGPHPLSKGARYWMEIEKILLLDTDPSRFFKILKDLEILEVFFPVHQLNLWDHNLTTLRNCWQLMKKYNFSAIERKAVLLSGFFHDMGKTADLALTRLGMIGKNTLKEMTLELISNHTSVGKISVDNPRFVRRFYNRLKYGWRPLLILAMADRLAHSPGENSIRRLEKLWKAFETYEKELPEKPPLLRGEDVLKLAENLGIKSPPGPWIGQILEEIEDERAEHPTLGDRDAKKMATSRLESLFLSSTK